jgi:aryl-alcohol dehydrogenase
MKTTAAVLRSADGPLRFEELDIEPLRPDEVLVKMVGVGICHTDLGVIAAPADGQTPIVLGHEGSGIVVQTGSAVAAVSAGDRVVLSYAYDGTCDNCESDLPMHCRDFFSLNLSGARADGSSPLSAGGTPILGAWFGQSSWATHAVTSERNCVKVAAGLPLELMGPLGCGLQTGAGAVLNTLRPRPGTSIAIFGVGSVGLAALLAAVAAGCETIIAVDIQDSRLERATQLGATHIINSTVTDPASAIVEITGRGAHYSVDCIGFSAVVRSALECLQTPGVCASVGFQGIPNEIAIDQGQLLFGKSLVGVVEGDAVPQVFIPQLITLYEQGKFPFDRLIQTFEFEKINEALDAVHHGIVSKAVLTFGHGE